MEKKSIFSLYHLFHLSSHIYLSFPYRSSFFLFAFHPHPPLFCFVCRGSSYEPEMLLWCFHKELRFQPLSRRMAHGGGEWGDFKSCFLMPLSRTPLHTHTHTSPLPLPFFHTVLLLHLSPAWCWRHWGPIDRVSIVSVEMLQRDKAKPVTGCSYRSKKKHALPKSI